jgi:RNA methyltransferase, TrmH family
MISRETIKHITSLREKKYREISGEFVVEGEKTISELLKSSLEIIAVYATAEWLKQNASDYSEKMYQFVEVTDNELKRISNFITPNKVLAVAKIKEIPLAEMNLHKGFTLMLDDIRDPGNMGTILRTADWFGVDTIICSATSVDLYNPKVIQASMGSFLRVKVAYTDLKSVLVQNPTIPAIGAFMEGTPVSVAKSEIESGFIIIGSEASGISKEIHSFITHKVSIPAILHGNSSPESMNAAVAAGIVMYELSRK